MMGWVIFWGLVSIVVWSLASMLMSEPLLFLFGLAIPFGLGLWEDQRIRKSGE